MSVEDRLAELAVIIGSLQKGQQILDGEMRRTRDRLHKIEGDRSAIKLLAQTINEMPEKMAVLADKAAETTLDKALSARGNTRIRLFGVWVQIAMLVLTTASTVTAVVLAVLRGR